MIKMFAVVKTGGKQYRVQAGDILRVERLAANAGEKVQFNQILMLGGEKTVIGSPLVAGAAVQADVIDQIKSEKTIKFVKRRRKHSSKRTRGHRQHLTLVRVTEILASGAEKSKVQAAVGSGSVDFNFTETVAPKKPVEDIMNRELIVATPHMSVYEVAQKMVEHEIEQLPVIKGEGELTGIVRDMDIIKVILGK
jgi:ribosomal protein L21